MTNLSKAITPPAATGHPFPVIGIVTPVRNRREWSLGFARMIARQDYPVFKLYIVDSSSTDGTPEALDDLNLAFLHVISAPDSYYWTGATNLGVKQALLDGCEYVLTINDDAIIADDYLSRMMASVVRTEARIVGSVIAYVDNPGKLWAVGAYNSWHDGAFLQLAQASKWDDETSFTSDDALLPVDYLCGNGSLFHRSVFEQIGIYEDKWTPHYHADSEFTMRAEKAGIKRWVSPAARVYNRFSEVGDGGFAARNRKFFSLRSSNYARATLYILDEYCDDNLKTRALVRYYAKYIHQQNWRTWSRLLRLSAFLSTPRAERRAEIRHFFPSLDQFLCAAQDLGVLLALPDEEFVIMAYAYILRRAPADEEIANFRHAISTGVSREAIVEAFLLSDEFQAVQPKMQEFMLGLVRLRTGADPANSAGRFTPNERWILNHLYQNGTIPTYSDLQQWEALPVASTKPVRTQDGRLKVYMNIDVMCMAMIDPRAGTGVHRYVSNLLWQLADDSTINLELFHSPRLAESCAKLLRHGSVPAHLRFAQLPEDSDGGVVFYPYFPLEGLDKRFTSHLTVMTVCDIFPLTNPEWFSHEAVVAFRRQMHDLSAADHVMCISRATEKHLLSILPGLTATTSFAHLGVTAPSKLPLHQVAPEYIKDEDSIQTSYFLCVGTIEPRKNLVSVIAAMKILQEDETADLEMWVVGQEGWSITSQELAELAGDAASRIKFLGRVADDELWRLYSGAICTVFPSLAEGFGFPIVESFAVGTPVVTGRGSSMGEIASRGALLVDSLDIGEIAAAIRSLATNQDLRDYLSQQSLQSSKEFTWQKCAAAHLKVFHDVSAAHNG